MNIAEQVAAFDAMIDQAMVPVRSPAVDHLAYRLSSVADHSLVWHMCGVVHALVHGDDVAWAARFSLALGAESVLTNGVLKTLFRRVRPASYDDIEFRHGLRRPLTSSFPSGHATSAFMVATLMDEGPVWYLVATAVAASRVYVRLHHASDVVAGAAVGIAVGRVLRPLVNRGS